MFKKLANLLLHNRSTSQTVVKNTIWLMVGEVAHSLRFIVAIFAARILGAANWGIFSYAVTLAGMFTIVSDIGISGVLNREVARNPENHAQYLSTSFFLKIFLIIFSIALILITAPFLLNIDGVKSFLIIICLILAFDSMRDFSFAIIRAKEKMEQEAVIKTVTNVGILVLGLAFLIFIPTPKALAWSYAIGSGLGLITGIWLLRPYLSNLFSNFTRKLVWPIFSSAWPFAMVALLSSLMINMDTVIIGHFRSAAEIGFYAAAQRPIQLFYTVSALISSAIFPSLAKSAKRDNARFRFLFEKVIAVTFLIGLPITIGGIILGKGVVQVLFGNQYLAGVLTFQLLLLTTTITFLYGILVNGLFAFDRQSIFTWAIAGGVLTNLILDLLLIPRYGISGSAIATIIAQLVVLTPLYIAMRKINFFLIWKNIEKIAVATITMGSVALIMNILKVNFYINLPIDVVIYFSMLYLLKEPLAEDIASVFGIATNRQKNP